MKQSPASFIAPAIFLFASLSANACPTTGPAGFWPTPDRKAFSDREKTVAVVVTCDERVKADQAVKAIEMLGERHKIDETLFYVDMKKGAMRIYVSTAPDVAQVSVVAKTPEALEKAAPAIIQFLKNRP